MAIGNIFKRGKKTESTRPSFEENNCLQTNVRNRYGITNECLAEQIYANKAPWLRSTSEQTMIGTGLGAAAAHEMARLITLETSFDISDEKILRVFEDVVAPNLRVEVEKGWALGGLMLRPCFRNADVELDSNDVCVSVSGKSTVSFVYPSRFEIVKFDERFGVSGVKFYSTAVEGGKTYVLAEWQNYDENNCSLEIVNKLFLHENGGLFMKNCLGREVPLNSTKFGQSVIPRIVFKGVEGPLVGHFKPAVVDNMNVCSPYGMSGLVRAAETLRRADIVFNALDWEIGASLARLYIDETAVFDRSDREFAKYLVKTQGNYDRQLFEKFAPDIREASYLNVYNAYLRQLEDTIGLARGTFSNVETVARTATEVAATRQRTFVTVADNQKALKFALVGLARAFAVWYAPRGERRFEGLGDVVRFGDGIFTADET